MKRVLVTGSRDWNDITTIRNAIFQRSLGVKDVIVVHGGAPGADSIAGYEAGLQGLLEEIHPANWDDCGDNCGPEHWRYRPTGEHYCARAGFKRNQKMVDLGADVCLAFIRNGSKGASGTARLAEKAGIPVHRYIQNDE